MKLGRQMIVKSGALGSGVAAGQKQVPGEDAVPGVFGDYANAYLILGIRACRTVLHDRDRGPAYRPSSVPEAN